MHSTFGTSRLVRQLAHWTPVDTPAATDVAERMSRWFDPLAAIRLQAVQQPLPPNAAAAASSTGMAAARVEAVAQDVQRVRAVLAHAIAQDPLVGLALAPAEDPGYAPYHQRHLELQRQMTQMVGALRDHVRQSLAGASAGMRQLAVLDATFEELLAPREQSLLPTVALLMQRRFSQLRGEPRETFAAEWRQALLNELELRLEPVAGMADALRHESGTES